MCQPQPPVLMGSGALLSHGRALSHDTHVLGWVFLPWGCQAAYPSCKVRNSGRTSWYLCASKSVGSIPRYGIPGIKGHIFLTWPAITRLRLKCWADADREGEPEEGRAWGGSREEPLLPSRSSQSDRGGIGEARGSRRAVMGKPRKLWAPRRGVGPGLRAWGVRGGGLSPEHLLSVCCCAAPFPGAVPPEIYITRPSSGE